MPDLRLTGRTMMADLAKIVLSGVNKAIDLGIADPDRVGLMGTSWGGYSTLALIVQTSRFKAAVMVAGFGDLLGAVPDAESGWPEWPTETQLTTGQGRDSVFLHTQPRGWVNRPSVSPWPLPFAQGHDGLAAKIHTIREAPIGGGQVGNVARKAG